MVQKHEVVVSGIAGKFPGCSNFQELEDQLYNNESLVKEITDRELPRLSGCMGEANKFDDTFFGIHPRLADVLDPSNKHIYEQQFSAILDAGIHPDTLAGTNTAIVVATSLAEDEMHRVDTQYSNHILLGQGRCFLSNRISYLLDCKGPSLTMSGSWETGFHALGLAQRLIEKGFCRQAIVGAAQIILKPHFYPMYHGLGRLNKDGKTKSFSDNADGYSRAEAVVIFFLQRAEDAKRSYGSIIKVLARSEMSTPCRLLDPYGMSNFLSDFYSDVKIKKDDIAFVEGDGSGILAIDRMELASIAEVMSPGRTKPLPISCIKSKLGHCEGSSGLVSVASALIALKTGYIPPVLNHNKPNPIVSANSGKIKIVTEKTPIEGDYAAVSGIGIGNLFGHALIKRNPKSRPPAAPEYFPKDGVPRVFVLSGRNKEDMSNILKKVKEDTIDDGLYFLDHSFFAKPIRKHLFRGYTVKSKENSALQISKYDGGNEKNPIWFIFSGMGSQWNNMGKGIMEVPFMRKSIEKCHKVLETKGMDLISIITSNDPTIYDNILHSFVGIAAIQIALVDMLEAIGVKCDGMVGHSVGELGCAYADKGLTAEQMMLCAWARGTASNEATLIKGMMAAIGMGYNDIKDDLPDGIEVACHNSANSCTLSGPVDLVDKYVKSLKSRGIFAKLVNVADIAYHSKNIKPAAPLLLKYLQGIIPHPKERSSKWISSSVPEDKWDSDAARYNSAEYHTNNLLGYVLFEEASKHVPNDAVCIEIAPHGLLQAIVKKSLPTCKHVALTSRNKTDSFFTMESLGKLFNFGVDIDLTKLYPPVDLPLPRETPYFHSFATWNHEENWDTVFSIFKERPTQVGGKHKALLTHLDDLFNYSLNHRMLGKPVAPLATIICRVMEYVTNTFEKDVKFNNYVFEDMKFYDPLVLTQQSSKTVVRTIYQVGCGKFETCMDRQLLLSGKLEPVLKTTDVIFSHEFLQLSSRGEGITLNQSNIYQFFEENDCIFQEDFRNIIEMKIADKAFIGKVRFTGNIEFYIDAILKLIMLYSSIVSDSLMEIKSIEQFVLDPSSYPEKDQDVFVYYDSILNQLSAPGVKITSFKTKPANSEGMTKWPVEAPVLHPLSKIKTQNEFLETCLQMVYELENDQVINIIANEKSKIYRDLTESQYFNSLLNSKNVTINSVNESERISDMRSGPYLFISDVKLPDSLVKIMDLHHHNCYLMQTLPESDITSISKFKYLTATLEGTFNKHKYTFYKKSINAMTDSNFIQVPDGYVLDKPNAKDVNGKINFYIFKYKDLNEIQSVVNANKTIYEMKNMRFVFIDSDAKFDPTQTLYLNQMKKDLKINVIENGLWGVLKNPVPASAKMSDVRLDSASTPFNKIRSCDVDLHAIGINLQDTVTPSMKHKIGVMDYCGIKKKTNEIVMGLAKMTSDYRFVPDPILYWEKPKNWTSNQASTVPFFYSVAYYLLHLRTVSKEYVRNNRVFIHGGHTAFSQAFIRVATKMNANVYTSCFTKEQKKILMARFPQLNDENIFILNGNIFMMDAFMSSTEGEGFSMIVDCLDDDKLRNSTIQCCGYSGTYFLVCNNDSDSDFTFGMSVFLNQANVMGFNPDIMLDISDEEKRMLVQLVQKGIQTGVVLPFDHIYVDDSLSMKEAMVTVISASKGAEGKKVLIKVNKAVERKQFNGTGCDQNIQDKRNYMIIGSYNCLWYDVLNWIACRGADNIYVLVDWNSVPNHIQIRFKSFLKRHSSTKVRFIPTENMNSAESFQNILKRTGQDLDKTIYIAPESEYNLKMVDDSLRKFNRDCCLVCIGDAQSSKIIDDRVKSGLKGKSFVLKKDNLRNRTIINVLDHWNRECEQDQQITIVDETIKDEDVMNESDILPKSVQELMDLEKYSVDSACIQEVSSLTTPYEFQKEVQPVIYFPGFKISKVESLSSKLAHPGFIVRYPHHIKSLDRLAEQLAQEISNKFDDTVFTFVCEGWSGPLVLRVLQILEAKGAQSAVIMIDAFPSKLRDWSSMIDATFLGKSLQLFHKDTHLTLNHIKTLRDKVCDNLCKETSEYDFDEFKKGLDILINRLECIEAVSETNISIASKIHLFSGTEPPHETIPKIKEISQYCSIECSHYIIPSNSILETDEIINYIKDLVAVEYKSSGRCRPMEESSTLEIKAQEYPYLV